jgi:hypothetical protein
MKLTKDEIERRLQELQDEMVTESFGKNYAVYYDLAEEVAMLTFALRQGNYRSPKAQPKACAHDRCGKPARTVDICDDHESNVGFWQITEYCSLACYVCHLKHAFDHARQDQGAEATKILRKIR